MQIFPNIFIFPLNFRSVLNATDQNLFFVDWSIGSTTLNYNEARTRVDEVGQVLGDLVNYLHLSNGLKIDELTMIGFSLGGKSLITYQPNHVNFDIAAHIAGIAGNRLKGQVGKIIGLDAAGPLFDVNDPDNRLSTKSAEYTECIHTGISVGIRDPICHADFYINKGSHQPNCGTILDLLCSHARVVEIYAEALTNPKAFYGYRCESLDQALSGNCNNPLGVFINGNETVNRKTSGIFHVETNGEPSYGRGKQE